MKHTRKAVAAVIGLVAALSLTACNGDDNASSDTGSKPTVSADQNGGGSDTGTGGEASDSGEGTDGGDARDTAAGTGDNNNGNDNSNSNSNSKVGICRTDELEVNATDNTTDKTEGVVTVVFKNGGGRDCSIKGYAGVDLTASTGDTLSVARNGEQAVPGVLKDGDSAAFNITFPYNNSGGSGVRITKLVVTPPNEPKHVTLDWPAGTLPVTDGEGAVKLEISPVGIVSDSPAG
ncbi:hypothetical protein GCM10010277_51020 [Streptomyces longisporoflavus]|uniref:DUF4232 domain-containing protein n=1 Tax=Streptomyces longisporoflavus TaxID=28044 RepID=UPI00167DC102|nr:DUF4232 domain-containing protein [Streptomyces longisporoflavus]GGV53443.1 hypothetical protein GCM10010277_51020 [Streptomyces longisporoflavus]